MKNRWKLKLHILPILFLALLQGCGGSSDSLQQQFASLTDVAADFEAEVLQFQSLPATFSPSLGGTADSVETQLLTLKEALKETFRYYKVETYQITYTVAGQQEPLSGLVAIPVPLLPGPKLEFPMISLQHPTQVLRDQSPSLVSKYGDEQLTVPFGTMLAAKGYIVAMPDYPGLGTNREVHPYGLLAIGKAVVGLIAAAGRSDQPWSSEVSWNGKLFLIGFSEGGYASLAAAREIEVNELGYDLIGVAALDGPYDLSGTMRNLMLTADQNFAAPYFLPYAVAAYGSAYGTEDPDLDFDNAVVSPLNTNLYPKLFGENTSEEISQEMSSVVLYEGPRSILTVNYLNDLGDPSSFLYSKLQVNNAFGWTPKSTIRLFHNPDDDLVPIGNFDEARVAWTGLPNVTFETFTDDLPGLGSVHAGSLVPAYIKAMDWIETLP